MSAHLSDRILDYLAGRLSPEERSEFDAHLRQCDACRDELSWVRELKQEALRTRLGHLPATLVVQLAADRNTALDEPERQHLESCASCRNEIEWARSLPLDDRSDTSMEPASSSGRAWGHRWLGLGLAAAAVAIVMLMLPTAPPSRLSEIARIEPLPVELTRDVGELDPFEEHRLRGLEQYAGGDYAGARMSLDEAASLRDDATVSLYLASSELLLGNRNAAAERLRRLVDQTSDAIIREEALWQLANAALAAGSVDESVSALESLIALQGHHRNDATSLLEALRSTGD